MEIKIIQKITKIALEFFKMITKIEITPPKMEKFVGGVCNYENFKRNSFGTWIRTKIHV